MRTFIALNLPQDERVRLHAALEPLRGRGLPVRWTAAQSLHLTVKFLGDTESGGIADIDAVMRKAAARRAPITLRLAGLGGFPSLRRANILWIGAAPDAELSALQREIEPALSRLGYPREQRPFRPHVTIGRTRSGGQPSDIERLGALVEYEATVVVESVDLMRSEAGPTGARYETLLRRRLGEPEEEY